MGQRPLDTNKTDTIDGQTVRFPGATLPNALGVAWERDENGPCCPYTLAQLRQYQENHSRFPKGFVLWRLAGNQHQWFGVAGAWHHCATVKSTKTYMSMHHYLFPTKDMARNYTHGLVREQQCIQGLHGATSWEDKNHITRSELILIHDQIPGSVMDLDPDIQRALGHKYGLKLDGRCVGNIKSALNMCNSDPEEWTLLCSLWKAMKRGIAYAVQPSAKQGSNRKLEKTKPYTTGLPSTFFTSTLLVDTEIAATLRSAYRSRLWRGQQ
jgi:hypothetical protein